MIKFKLLVCIVAVAFCAGCGTKIKEKKDEIYSRYLQKHIPLLVITTPVPDNKSDFNLLVLNDGQDLQQLHLKEIVDSLYDNKLIKPLLIVAITALDRMQWYGVAGHPDYLKNGNAAEKYADFVINELLPFVKKRAGVRKFSSTTIAGFSMGAVSAFDIVWNHADKIDKVGIFSGSFWLRNKDANDPAYSSDKNRIVFNMVKSSRKRPKLQYWFYAGGSEENADRDQDGIIDVVDDTKGLIELIKTKKTAGKNDIKYIEVKEGKHDYPSWSNVVPQFLIWAVGK